MSVYPRVTHGFLRNPNMQSSDWFRVANRYDPLKNTLTMLEDPKNKRTLHLIGTTNSSSLLAQRTKELVRRVKPDLIYVQTDRVWWGQARHIDTTNHEVFTALSRTLPTQPYRFENNIRGLLFRLRYSSWISKLGFLMQLQPDFQPFTPGLEIYHALKYAEQANCPLHFGGVQFDEITIEALRMQPDLYWITNLLKGFFLNLHCRSYGTELHDLFDTLHVRGGEAFAESIDRSRANLIVALFNRVFPKVKPIVIDNRDYRIFTDIHGSRAKNIVAVVNQWHAHGVEQHWRRATHTLPAIAWPSPVADMPIDEIQDDLVIEDYLKNRNADVSKSQPSTAYSFGSNYHKENYELERSYTTIIDSHQEIPSPGQPKIDKHH